MNNKGQVLVIFVIILPIIFILLALVIDIGLLYVEKRNINNSLRDAVDYALDNASNPNLEDKVKILLNKNISHIDKINFIKNNDYIEITVIKNIKGNYSVITKNTEIKITYKGIIQTKEIIKG